MLVFRVEDDTGLGMFRADNSPSCMFGHEYDFDTHPTPNSDINGWSDLHWSRQEEFVFGCECIEDIEHWLRITDVEVLRRFGFYIQQYHVTETHVLMGSRQVAFRKCMAKKKERIEL